MEDGTSSIFLVCLGHKFSKVHRKLQGYCEMLWVGTVLLALCQPVISLLL